jgi:hypothetical protein
MLPFRLVSGSLIQVEGRLGNQKHLKLILDTGSSMIGERIAEKLKLDAHTAESFNFDQNLKWKTATRPEVQFGPVRAANVVVLVGDLVRYSEFAAKADAIIGMDLLNLRDVTIDFAAGRLIFEAAKVTAYVPGGDPMAKCLMVELRVQDRPVRLLIDTGLDEERLQQSAPVYARPAASKRHHGRTHAGQQAMLPDIVFGKRSREVLVLLLPSPAEDTLPGIDGIVGISALQARRVHISFSGKTLSGE